MAKTKSGAQTIGKNISYEMDGDVLVLRIDTTQDFGPSNSGKTIIIASTEGNKTIGDVRVGLNCYKYPQVSTAGKKAKK